MVLASRRVLWAALAGVSGAAGGLPAHAAPSGPLYVDDANGLLGTVDLSTDAVTVLGDTGLGGNLTDIGFQNGSLYGTTFTDLYGLNGTTAAATHVTGYGIVGGSGMNALVGSTGSNLYAASGSTDLLYSITPGGATTTLSGSTGGLSAGDLAFANGSLYESVVGDNGNAELVKLSLSGNSVSNAVVGYFTTGGSQLDSVYGLATGDDGVTYAVNGTSIYSVNLANADLSLVDDYGGHGLAGANGTAFISESPPPTPPPNSVPEPASIALLGAALASLAMVRGRSRA